MPSSRSLSTRLLLAFSAVLSLANFAHAQITNVTNDQATPIPGVGHDYLGTLEEIVSPGNGSLSLRIAVPTPGGRGITLPFRFSYNSNGIIRLYATPYSVGVVANPATSFM